MFFALERQGGKIKTERDLIHAAYAEVKGTRVDFTLKERSGNHVFRCRPRSSRNLESGRQMETG